MPEQDPEFIRSAAELARRAYAAMAASIRPAPAHRVASFRLWHLPAAGPQISWVVFNPRRHDWVDAPPVARKLEWDRDGDGERLQLSKRRLEKLEPSLRVVEFQLDPTVLARFMKEANGLGLPRNRLVRPYVAEHPPEYGLEGFDLMERSGRQVVRIEWEGNAPLQLEAIAYWADSVRHWLIRQAT